MGGWGRRKRVDEEGDKQLKKLKNRDKKQKWKRKKRINASSLLQTKVRFLQSDSRDYAPEKFPSPD